MNNQDERKYLLDALKCVHTCAINSGSGIMDFADDLETVKPDVLVVNEDGHTPEKEAFVVSKSIQYLVLKRIPHGDLPARSTTFLRTRNTMPFRIDIAGGWLDQPFVSKYHPGPVITISIEPTLEFNERSGMASSTRRKALELWHTDIPAGDPEQLAQILFSYDNPPGTTEFSGSQDALGIVLPGLNQLHYDGAYWPCRIDCMNDESLLSWLEDHLYLINLGPRQSAYNVLDNTHIDQPGAAQLAEATDRCWSAILKKNIQAFGRAFRASFEAQIQMFPT